MTAPTTVDCQLFPPHTRTIVRKVIRTCRPTHKLTIVNVLDGEDRHAIAETDRETEKAEEVGFLSLEEYKAALGEEEYRLETMLCWDWETVESMRGGLRV